MDFWKGMGVCVPISSAYCFNLIALISANEGRRVDFRTIADVVNKRARQDWRPQVNKDEAME